MCAHTHTIGTPDNSSHIFLFSYHRTLGHHLFTESLQHLLGLFPKGHLKSCKSLHPLSLSFEKKLGAKRLAQANSLASMSQLESVTAVSPWCAEEYLSPVYNPSSHLSANITLIRGNPKKREYVYIYS